VWLKLLLRDLPYKLFYISFKAIFKVILKFNCNNSTLYYFIFIINSCNLSIFIKYVFCTSSYYYPFSFTSPLCFSQFMYLILFPMYNFIFYYSCKSLYIVKLEKAYPSCEMLCI